MSLIINIDTALQRASVCLSENETVLYFEKNENQQDHAVWLHAALAGAMEQSGKKMQELAAVAVSNGPGSYTGLRVGLSAAKGLCYALKIPLITVDTLQLMAMAVKEEASDLICPLIDARRMEVFTAVYDKELQPVVMPTAMVIAENSFSALLSRHTILFCGDGRKKLQSLISAPNTCFSDTGMTSIQLSQIAHRFYREKKFADLAYAEPFYIKEFYTTAQKKPL